MKYGSTNEDDLGVRDFINKDDILSVVSEEEIFALVFGFLPSDLQYTTSPFREDNDPGAWFEIAPNGKMLFKDFGDPVKSHYDCFDAVRRFFGLKNFYESLQFVFDHLIRGKNLPKGRVSLRQAKKKKEPVEIVVRPKPFDSRDGAFWTRYNITKAQLIDDKVFSLRSYKMLKTKTGNHTFLCDKPCFAYTGFDNNRKKIYSPYKKKGRFITNCISNDVGQINQIHPLGEQLVITKSYKDCRVLRNLGLHCVWFQSEKMHPTDNVLFPLIDRFRKTLILFDNDETGIGNAKNLSERINSKKALKSKYIYLPPRLLKEKIKDPSDLLYRRSEKDLVDFLKINAII